MHHPPLQARRLSIPSNLALAEQGGEVQAVFATNGLETYFTIGIAGKRIDSYSTTSILHDLENLDSLCRRQVVQLLSPLMSGPDKSHIPGVIIIGIR